MSAAAAREEVLHEEAREAAESSGRDLEKIAALQVAYDEIRRENLRLEQVRESETTDLKVMLCQGEERWATLGMLDGARQDAERLGLLGLLGLLGFIRV